MMNKSKVIPPKKYHIVPRYMGTSFFFMKEIRLLSWNL